MLRDRHVLLKQEGEEVKEYVANWRRRAQLPMIPGTSNATRLLDSSRFGTVSQIQVQLDCNGPKRSMGRQFDLRAVVVGGKAFVLVLSEEKRLFRNNHISTTSNWKDDWE